MSKFLNRGTLCLYLDQFAACRVFTLSPPTEWAEVAALIKRGVDDGKLLCPNSIEQMIETTGLDKEPARLLDSETRKYSSGWCFFPETDITANYLICRVRQIKVEKIHFVHRSKQNLMNELDVYEKLGERNKIFREMVSEGTESVNAIRKAAHDGAQKTKQLRDFIVQHIKSDYAQEMKKRMFWLGTKGGYSPQTVTLAGYEIPFWADVVCQILVVKHQLTQLEAQAAFWILEKEGIDAIPSLNIRASLESMLAFRGVAESANDQIDILRIAGALPFADLMLIDGPKANDVRELKLDKKFQTNVYSGKKAELERLKNDLTVIIGTP